MKKETFDESCERYRDHKKGETPEEKMNRINDFRSKGYKTLQDVQSELIKENEKNEAKKTTLFYSILGTEVLICGAINIYFFGWFGIVTFLISDYFLTKITKQIFGIK